MTEKWDEIQGKLDLVRVSGEFELSGFYCKLKYLLYFFPAATWSDLFETESGILEVSLCSFPKCEFFLLSCALFAAQTDSRFLTSVFGLSKIANILRDLTKTSPSGFQQMWFSLQLKKLRSVIICVAYRSPSCP